MANYECKGKPGNKSRTGMVKPAKSGRQPVDVGGTSSLTVRITLRQARFLAMCAKDGKVSVGNVIRGAIDDLIDAYEY